MANQKKNNWIIIGVFVAAVSLYIGRSNLLNPIKMILWGFILVQIFLTKEYKTNP